MILASGPSMNSGSAQGNHAWRTVRLVTARCAYLALLAPSAACGTHSRRLDQPTPLKPDVVVWVWRGAVGQRWRQVVIGPDSVSGIPYDWPPCDDCRRSIPRSQVDSMVVVRRGVSFRDAARTVGGTALAACLVYSIVELFNPNAH